MHWKIEEYDTDKLLGSYSLPGSLGSSAVIEVMRQLAARHLNPEEIILSSRRKGTRGRCALLDSTNTNGILQVGENPFLVARRTSE